MTSHLLDLLDDGVLYLYVLKDGFNHHVHRLEVFVRQRRVEQRHRVNRCKSGKQTYDTERTSDTHATYHWILHHQFLTSTIMLLSQHRAKYCTTITVDGFRCSGTTENNVEQWNHYRYEKRWSGSKDATTITHNQQIT